MKSYFKPLVIAGLTVLVGVGPMALAAPVDNPSQMGRYIVIADGWSVKDRVLSQAKGKGAQVISEFDSVPGMAVMLPEAAAAALANNPHVKAIGADVVVHATDVELDNSWGVKRIGAGTVHAFDQAAGVKVGVIDTGIDYTHPDLDGNYAGGYDFVNGDADPRDDHGHGTHVSGIIAAEDNNSGVVGVGPQASLYGLKVLDASGSGYMSDIILALDWAVANGIQVVNMSLGASVDAPGVHDAVVSAYNSGVVLVAAAGNSGNCAGKNNTVEYPARYDEVIAVAATDSSDSRACFSSTGSQVELSAPGVSVMSTYIGGYAMMSGTSMASPHVAGVAALVLGSGSLTDQNGDGTVNNVDVRLKLQATADDLGRSGRDIQYGYGLVDAAEAAAYSGPVDNPPSVSLTAPVNGTTVSGLVPISAVASDDDGVVRVDFYLDGAPLGSDSVAPYEWTWDSTVVSDGNHVILATAVDTAAQETSTSVTVTVDNVVEPPVQSGQATVSSIAYSTSGGRYGDAHLSVAPLVVDGDGNPVSGATVSFVLSLDSGETWTASGVTGSDGQYTFKVTGAPAGCYSTVITDVSATGLDWDAATPDNGFCKQ